MFPTDDELWKIEQFRADSMEFRIVITSTRRETNASFLFAKVLGKFDTLDHLFRPVTPSHGLAPRTEKVEFS